MKKLHYLIALASAVIMISSLEAKPLVFSNFNFSIEIPDDWIILESSKTTYAIIARNSNNTKSIVVAATQLKPYQASRAAADFRDGSKASAIQDGWKVSKDQPTTIADVPFISFTATRNDIAAVYYVTSAGDYCYGIKCEAYTDKMAEDPELSAIIYSFKLLSPAKINLLAGPTKITAYVLPKKMNDFLALFTIPALLLIGGLVYYNGSMRKRNDYGSDSMD